ncbi:hypothetical protein [Sphingomonas sp.]|uniref:hypothetical protein n=1 Tax=Sphingomonas sp. TaxID=28214 RepID=UPI0025D8F48F|nr:hypothetical protein [Sphingomonas sp.]MBV9529318.1 hypothetical protein [Sphingomonas sp.]
MIDEIFDRTYQAGRAHLNEALALGMRRFAHEIRNAFIVLNRIEYDAPWSQAARRSRSR